MSARTYPSRSATTVADNVMPLMTLFRGKKYAEESYIQIHLHKHQLIP